MLLVKKFISRAWLKLVSIYNQNRVIVVVAVVVLLAELAARLGWLLPDRLRLRYP